MNIWTQPGNRVVALAPGHDDLFCITMLFGKIVFFEPVTAYEKALKIAEAFANHVQQPRPVSVKVLCLSGAEALTFLNMKASDLFQGQTPEEEEEMRQAAVAACKDALLKSPDATVRADALKLLTDMGLMQC